MLTLKNHSIMKVSVNLSENEFSILVFKVRILSYLSAFSINHRRISVAAIATCSTSLNVTVNSLYQSCIMISLYTFSIDCRKIVTQTVSYTPDHMQKNLKAPVLPSAVSVFAWTMCRFLVPDSAQCHRPRPKKAIHPSVFASSP